MPTNLYKQGDKGRGSREKEGFELGKIPGEVQGARGKVRKVPEPCGAAGPDIRAP